MYHYPANEHDPSHCIMMRVSFQSAIIYLPSLLSLNAVNPVCIIFIFIQVAWGIVFMAMKAAPALLVAVVLKSRVNQNRIGVFGLVTAEEVIEEIETVLVESNLERHTFFCNSLDGRRLKK